MYNIIKLTNLWIVELCQMEKGLTMSMTEETLQWEITKIYRLEENNRQWGKNAQEHRQKDHLLLIAIWDNMFLPIETWETAEVILLREGCLLREGYLEMKDLIVPDESSHL